jgi:hypothetical protein
MQHADATGSRVLAIRAVQACRARRPGGTTASLSQVASPGQDEHVYPSDLDLETC